MSDVKEAAEQAIPMLGWEREVANLEWREDDLGDKVPVIIYNAALVREKQIDAFIRGAKWQLAQLRCVTCKWCEIDEGVYCDYLHALTDDRFGCVKWEGKE